MLPPPRPAHHLDRAVLLDRLGPIRARHLSTVVAGAGFGKSTLLADWSAHVGAAWYTVDAHDSSLAVLVPGLIGALRQVSPELSARLETAVPQQLGPEADSAERAGAVAAMVADTIEGSHPHECALVLDDLHELAADGAGMRLVELLARQGPANMQLVLSSREPLPFGVERLRGRGQLLELDSADLALSTTETSELLVRVTGRDDHELTRWLHEVTNGWPAATRLAAEALDGAEESEWAANLERVRAPGGRLFSWLAEEVVSREDAAVRELLPVVARLERFNADLCRHVAGPEAGTAVSALTRSGAYLCRQTEGGWYSLHDLVREVIPELLPLDEDRWRPLARRAAEWLTEAGHLADALSCLDAAGDGEAVVDLLRRHGRALLRSGAVEAVVAAADHHPEVVADRASLLVVGEARQVTGDWDGALRCFTQATDTTPEVPASLAWRMGLIHYLRGELDDALEVFERGRLDGSEPEDEAQLLGWTATVHWRRGDTVRCRHFAHRALEGAEQTGDPDALASAHIVLAMLAAIDGDRRQNYAHEILAEEAATRAGNVLHLVRLHGNRGSHGLEEGDYAAAIDQLEAAIRLAEVTGYAPQLGLALCNRGDVLVGLGRLEEAYKDYTSARETFERIGSRMIAYALRGLGDVHRERGELALARTAYEEAAEVAGIVNDHQGVVPALAGLARVVLPDDPVEAAEIAARAVAAGPDLAHEAALVAAGWVAAVSGRYDEAAGLATEAAAEARSRRSRPRLAEALERRAVSTAAPELRADILEEAASVWSEIGNPIGLARVELALARLDGSPLGQVRAAAASERLRELGARPRVDELAGATASGAALDGSVAVRSLGAFQVLRAGRPVPQTEWQSRKARDLLKLLVGRRGRPSTRESLMAELWPDEDPARLGNRLSQLLSTVRAVLDPGRRHDAEHFLRADRDSVVLDLDHLDVDVERFLQFAHEGLSRFRDGDWDGARPLLAAADEVAAGEFLEEDPYAAWAVPLREEARAAAVAVARALAEGAAAHDAPDLAVHHFLRVLEVDPYDEPGHLSLVRTLRTSGGHGEARRQYRVYVERMSELGVEPAPFPAVPA